MKQLLPAMLVSMALLTGCASRYIVTLTNGQRIVAAEKPHLEDFNFVFTDLKGLTNSIPSTYVRGIVPASSQTPAK